MNRAPRYQSCDFVRQTTIFYDFVLLTAAVETAVANDVSREAAFSCQEALRPSEP